MINRRLALGLIAVATTIDASQIAFAKDKHHLNGKDLLGEKIKKNGKHKIHTTGKKADVFAEVSNGKVTAVTAAGMQVKKVKSRQKLAETSPGITLVGLQLAQADVYYYGYWVYDDLTDYYYWFPADYVIVDSSWVDYTAQEREEASDRASKAEIVTAGWHVSKVPIREVRALIRSHNHRAQRAAAAR